MGADLPLSVLFLWHQHQPLYKDPLANRYELPWVRLHATKDYYDMAALLDEFPSIKANFNLVPSLLTQLDDYAQGKAEDKFLDVSRKNAASLSVEDRQFILENFFMAHWEHMVDPYARYRELLDKRGRRATPESLSQIQKYFKEPDWRDLQTWFNLTWFDPLWREKDPFIKGLYEKGKLFTEEEKQKLLDKQRDICGLVVSKHKELQDRGQIEITTTPYYHPILPLICDSETARLALPHATLPVHRFQHSEDAREQLRRAVEDYTRRFGKAPQGMWPSEGSVSEEAARLISETGIRWIATDEAVLARSLGTASDFNRDKIYEPYRMTWGDKTLHFFFRDHDLSDAIGFTYASWDPEDAAKDFLERLHGIQARLKRADGDKPRPHVVPVILDGENCWEYYKEDGLPFLRALYRRLAQDPSMTTVRGGDYLDFAAEPKLLPKLWAGSWINANFAIWIGHAEDNSAWDLLHRTRQFLKDTIAMRPGLTDAPQTKKAWEEIYIAEGSDWCWWYGDDHSSANDETFDYLFRKHLMNVYLLIGEKVPEDLHFPIKKKRAKTTIAAPADFMTPTLDGRVSNYFEWQSAGVYHTEAGATGTMHKSENLVRSVYYGFDLENLYFRLDLNKPLTPETLNGITLKFVFYKPLDKEISAEFDKEKKIKMTPGTGTCDKIIEFALPLAQLDNPEKQEFQLYLVVMKDGLEQERWPADSTLHIPFPSSDVFVENWHI